MKFTVRIKDPERIEPVLNFLKQLEFLEILPEQEQPSNLNATQKAPIFLLLLFFLSGFAALIYQVAWQRVLFTLYGSDIESTTVIVAVFMFGLGIGSLLGGYLSKKLPAYAVLLFSVIELGIGLYGIFSTSLIYSAASVSAGAGLIGTTLWSFLLLFIPTILMGASLPVLVSFINRSVLNAGSSVASLYLYNTLGSAVASIVTVMVLFELFGLAVTVRFAALFNFIVAVSIFLKYRKHK